MSDSSSPLAAFADALNAIKRTAHPISSLRADHYLGGDLGIDSIEMLEIWFRAEKSLGIKLPDDAKRDIYTVGEVLAVLDAHANAGVTADV
jgi:acyl carrier protein